MQKGFAMNDDLLKNAGGGNYFEELLTRIRDIRSSEKVFYRKVLDIYATSIDYDSRAEMTQRFFQTVQNKMHFAVHGLINCKWHINQCLIKQAEQPFAAQMDSPVIKKGAQKPLSAKTKSIMTPIPDRTTSLCA